MEDAVYIDAYNFNHRTKSVIIRRNIYTMTEKEKMLAGMIYSAVDKQLLEELNAVKEIIHRYNVLSPADNAGRLDILKGLPLCLMRRRSPSEMTVSSGLM